MDVDSVSILAAAALQVVCHAGSSFARRLQSNGCSQPAATPPDPNFTSAMCYSARIVSCRVIKPMRYWCRPAGKPPFYDTKRPWTYDARRDGLAGFWKELFGHCHGLMLVSAFFQNVSRHRAEGRELTTGEKVENLILGFTPRPEQEMLVACLWSRWTAADEPDLLSCAAITDEPPREVAAAGHDRCIVPIRPERIDAWLSPDPHDLSAQQALLEDRARPYYEHRLAA